MQRVIHTVRNGPARIFIMNKIFIDTNLLVYSMDNYNYDKQKKCRSILKIINKKYYGVISTQVLQEFFVTVTKKLNADPLIAKNIMRTFYHYEIVTVAPELIQDAIDCYILNKLTFWDSLIIVAAESAKCISVWTEDSNDGQKIRNIKIFNPLNNFNQL